MKTITLKDILTDSEIRIAQKIHAGGGENGDSIAKTITRRIISPNITRINKALGQENDERYLGYLVEHIISEATKNQLQKN